MQYGKLISYWHCRVNTLTSVTRCDCERKLLDDHKQGDAHTTITAKEKTEEIIVVYEPHENRLPVCLRLQQWPSCTDRLPNVYTAPVFQPPRL